MIISKELVQLNMDATTKEDVLVQLSKVAAANGKISDEQTYIDAVLKREAEYSTAVGFGVAIPHGKSEAVNEPFLMYTSAKDIDWNSMDGAPVDLVFLIGVPAGEAGTTHLKILAALSRKLMKEDFRNGLRDAATPDEVIDFLEKSELGI